MTRDQVPVLDVGGTHVAAAIVDTATWELVSASTRLHLAADGPAGTILDTLVAAADGLGADPGSPWGVAMPDPFDYAGGVAWFDGVGKFESLYGFDVGAALTARVRPRPGRVRFVNDADAFTLGEWRNGSGTGARRVAGITLGTGVGSGWIADGVIVDSGPDVPPGGRAHRLRVAGQPLEDVMSRRALRRAYAAATGDTGADVDEICARARDGEAAATRTLDVALRALGATLAGPITRFAAEVVVVGGSMTRSWDVLEPPFLVGFATVATPPPLAVARDADEAPLIGAAWAAS